jgi:hypothetical protein
MQKRMLGELLAPQRAHLIDSGVSDGGGTPIAGVGGAMRG